MADSLPVVRSHELMEFKRCPKKWYWHWRLGLEPKAKRFSALDMGTWVHEAFEKWYCPGTKRWGALAEIFDTIAHNAIEPHLPQTEIDRALEMRALGVAMLQAYEKYYNRDSALHIITTEVALEFSFGHTLYKLKPDGVFRDPQGRIWLLEHKTAAQIMTAHLPIDGQARPYGAMAERALINAGILDRGDYVYGIMYNFLRKAVPDERPVNEKGQSLNQNGTVSARQPTPHFVRHPVHLSRAAKEQTLKRLAIDIKKLGQARDAVRERRVDPATITKTPDKSCPRMCQYFAMCVAEEEGVDITSMRKDMYRVENPYAYGETTDEPLGFG